MLDRFVSKIKNKTCWMCSQLNVNQHNANCPSGLISFVIDLVALTKYEKMKVYSSLRHLQTPKHHVKTLVLLRVTS